MLLTPGNAAFIPSGETHGTRGPDQGELITINAELEWCEENCDLTQSDLGHARLDTVSAGPLRDIMGHASVLLRASDTNELYIESIGITATLGLFHALGLRSRRAPAAQSAGPLRRVTAWIDEHLDEKISLPTLATMATCSQWHLIRLFNSFLGISPARYVTRRRLEKSRELLSAPGSDITDVALRCGFSSQSHFTRAFVREYGQSPGVYRSKRRSS
ncbi:MAG TPA: AraC family transcriptional regulator [Blastocatellia bacterium]|nr:AraC family transcriptional regulator [Blastocatellia bacterium]